MCIDLIVNVNSNHTQIVSILEYSYMYIHKGQYSSRNETFIDGRPVLDFFDLRPNSEWQMVGYLSIFLPVFIGFTWLALKFVNHSSR